MAARLASGGRRPLPWSVFIDRKPARGIGIELVPVFKSRLANLPAQQDIPSFSACWKVEHPVSCVDANPDVVQRIHFRDQFQQHQEVATVNGVVRFFETRSALFHDTKKPKQVLGLATYRGQALTRGRWGENPRRHSALRRRQRGTLGEVR